MVSDDLDSVLAQCRAARAIRLAAGEVDNAAGAVAHHSEQQVRIEHGVEGGP
jgi:hypothetical protein